MAQLSTVLKRLLVIPPLLIGATVLYWQASGRQPPAVKPVIEASHAVRVFTVTAAEFTPIAEGFGTAQPARVWSAVAEVAGRVIEVHPNLRNGVILPAGTSLLRIDPVDYQLAIAQARAQLAELEVQAANTQASLEIEQRSLQLIEREAKRVDHLVARGTLSQNEADATTRSVLNARAQVQNLRNTLALIPVQRNTLETQLARAERDLQHTQIVAPFALRVAAVAIENDQYVSTGQKLFEGDSIDRAEVLAQFPMAQIRNLVLGRTNMNLDARQMNQRLAELAGFSPTVLLDTGQHVAEWQAEFVRVSDTVDPQTRTIGMVVAVDKPYQKALPGVRPPLSKGMFVRVLMRGRVQSERLLIPRSAVRNGVVYIADDNNRLRRREIEIAFFQDDLAVLATGLQPGERVVLSDLVPVVEGMLLNPQLDQNLTTESLSAAEATP